MFSSCKHPVRQTLPEHKFFGRLAGLNFTSNKNVQLLKQLIIQNHTPKLLLLIFFIMQEVWARKSAFLWVNTLPLEIKLPIPLRSIMNGQLAAI